MKLHGWEQPEGLVRTLAPLPDQPKSSISTKWNLWRIENEQLRVEVGLADVADFSNYFAKFKSDLSFSILENFDGHVLKKIYIGYIFYTTF